MDCPTCESDCHVQRSEPKGLLVINTETYAMGALILFKCSRCMVEWFMLKGGKGE